MRHQCCVKGIAALSCCKAVMKSARIDRKLGLDWYLFGVQHHYGLITQCCLRYTILRLPEPVTVECWSLLLKRAWSTCHIGCVSFFPQSCVSYLMCLHAVPFLQEATKWTGKEECFMTSSRSNCCLSANTDWFSCESWSQMRDEDEQERERGMRLFWQDEKGTSLLKLGWMWFCRWCKTFCCRKGTLYGSRVPHFPRAPLWNCNLTPRTSLISQIQRLCRCAITCNNWV